MATDERDEPLSPEEQKVNAIFEEYDLKIDELQSRIDNISQDRPHPVPRPTWAKGHNEVKNVRMEADLKKSISELEKEGKGKAAKVFEKSQPGIQAKLYEKTDQWRNPNHKGKEQEKSLDQSQGYIERLKAGGKMALDQKQIDQDSPKFGKEYAESKHDVTANRSNYYSRLEFNSMDKDESLEPAKTDRSIDIDKD